MAKYGLAAFHPRSCQNRKVDRSAKSFLSYSPTGIAQRYMVSIPETLRNAIIERGLEWSDLQSYLKSDEGYEVILGRKPGVPGFFQWGQSNGYPPKSIEVMIPYDRRLDVRKNLLKFLADCLNFESRAYYARFYKRNDRHILEPCYVRRVLNAVRRVETIKPWDWLRNSSIPVYMSIDEITNQVNTGKGSNGYGDFTYLVRQDVLTILLVSGFTFARKF